MNTLVLLQCALDVIMKIIAIFRKHPNDVPWVPIFAGSHVGQRHSESAWMIAKDTVEHRNQSGNDRERGDITSAATRGTSDFNVEISIGLHDYSFLSDSP